MAASAACVAEALREEPGAWGGAAGPDGTGSRPARWAHRTAVGLAALTFPLILAGGSVTTSGSSLAVPDWPTTFGRFMFAFPLREMKGGIFFEHGHRLIASTAGLLTLALAVLLWRTEPRKWVRRLGAAALGAVLLQGALGGLTVLLRRSPAVSIGHAMLAQAFFCLTVALAMATSGSWRTPAERRPEHSEHPLRRAALATTAVLYAQILLGAVLRHTGSGLIPHVLGALAAILGVSVCVSRILAHYDDAPGFRRAAWTMLALLGVQLALGVVSYVLVQGPPGGSKVGPSTGRLALVTAHVGVGALLLASSFGLTLRAHRQLARSAVA